MDYYEAIRLKALREVVNVRRPQPKDDGDPDYPIRKIFRAYSEKWNTPLPQVEALPLEDVLIHFYEDLFEQMDEKELEAQVTEALLDPDDVAAAQRKEDEDDAFTYEVAKDAEEENRLAELKAVTAAANNAINALQGRQERPMRMGAEPDLIPRHSLGQKPKTEEISMSFATEDEVDLDGGMFGLLSTPKTG